MYKRQLLLPDAVDVHGSPAGGGIQTRQPFPGGIVAYGISPVSYTHLPGAIQTPDGRRAVIPLRDVAPVSYTHLDVYKRQV